ncbi:MAG: terminase small subunit [Pyrinomonadaceae bacterium]
MENGEAPPTIEEIHLNDKQKKFAHEYLACLNASKAALAAGYSPKTAYQIGFENLRKPHIRRYIDERLNATVLGKQEVLTLLSRQATADIADLFGEDGSIDIEKVRDRRYSHLVESFRINDGKVEVKLIDRQNAAIQLGKFHKLFTQKVELDATLFFNWSDLVREAETEAKQENEYPRDITESGLQDHSDTFEA